MNDLIRRQVVIDAMKKHKTFYCDNSPESFRKLSYGDRCRVDEIDNCIAELVNTPSARNHGHWIDCKVSGHLKCSECGDKAPSMFDANREEYDEWYSPFCPNCGADMRGEDDG